MSTKTSRLAGRWLPLLALALWVLALSFAQKAGGFMAGIDIRFGEGQGTSPAQVRDALRHAKEDGKATLPGMTLWGEEGGKTLSDEAGLRYTGTKLITCFGAGEVAYPSVLLYGGWPIRGDEEGIALSAGAADALWGGVGAVGQTVLLEGRTYYLRGVFHGEEPLALVQDREDSETPYPRMVMDAPEAENSQVQSFLAGTPLDLPFLSWLLTALAGLPGLLLLVALLLRLLGRLWRLRYSPLLLAQGLVPALLLGALALWGGGFPWHIPAKLIPTRFSDLDFWGKLAAEIGGGVRGVVSGTMASRDLALWGSVLACLLLLPVACALTLLALRGARAERLRQLLLGGLLAMGVALALAAVWDTTLSPAILALPTLWLITDFALFHHQASLTPAERHEEGSHRL